jgi:hydroxyacylglutathione hydrolase
MYAASVRIRQFVLGGLGHLSALVWDEASREAVVVDPRRDVDVYLDAAREEGVRIAYVVETHLHNDYVSGARELAALTGAPQAIGAGAELRYEHRPLKDGEAVEAGTLRFSARDTPGHTPEHVAFAVADRARADEPVVLFTGGSLLVGAVGRTDLLGAENAVPFAHAMFRSLHDVVLRHEDFVGVYPTHGAGSLCSAGTSGTPQTTVGFERRYNPLLRHEDAETFARALLTDQPAFPSYFTRMRPLNQAGPSLLGGRLPDVPALPADAARRAVADGALLVDLRPAGEHAAGHPPGALSIPSDESFGTWLGWVVEPDRPIVMLVEDEATREDAVRQAVRIGYDGSLIGTVAGGWPAWIEAGGPVAEDERLSIDELARRLHGGGEDAPFVVDVRQATEYGSGHIPGSLHVLAADLPSRLAELPRDRPIATICASGFRASIAASMLRQAGFERVASVHRGVPAWEAAGLPIERGEAESSAEEAPAHAH